MYFNREALEGIVEKNLDLAEAKNKDYSGTIDNITATGKVGLAVRIFDKASRLLSLVQPGHTQEVKDESIRDTANDLCNYALFLVSVLDGTWGKNGTTEDNKSIGNGENWQVDLDGLEKAYYNGYQVDVRFLSTNTKREEKGRLQMIDEKLGFYIKVGECFHTVTKEFIMEWKLVR